MTKQRLALSREDTRQKQFDLHRRTPVDDLVADRLGLATPLSRKKLDKARMALLRQTVKYAKAGSPLYRRRLASLDEASLRTEIDLERLPLLASAELAATDPSLLAVSLSRVARVVTLQTSGSTGQPKRVLYGTEDLAATREFFQRGMTSLIDAEARVLVLLPWEVPDSVGDLLIQALAEGGVYAEGLWPPIEPEATAAMVRRQALSCVVGLPQHLLALSIALRPGDVRTMLLCSDYAAPALRRCIEEECDCETFLHYGSTESGLGGGVECYRHCGCHLRESDLLVEIVDSVSGRQLPEGERGEVVITTLGHRAMPLIRYRTGDEARLIRSPCDCGGITARLVDIGGRLKGVVLASGGRLHSRELDDRLFKTRGLLDYRAILDRVDKADRLRLEVVATPGIGNAAVNEVGRLLLQVAVIRESLAEGSLVLGAVEQVERFAPDHTVKRTILDLR